MRLFHSVGYGLTEKQMTGTETTWSQHEFRRERYASESTGREWTII